MPSEMPASVANSGCAAKAAAAFSSITYATTNFATLLHSVAGHPNFRPRFRYFSWHTAALGFLSCLALMFLTAVLPTALRLR